MRKYKIQKCQMKITYEAWHREIEKETLIHFALLKAIQTRQKDSAECLKHMVRDLKYNEQHRLFSADEQSE